MSRFNHKDRVSLLDQLPVEEVSIHPVGDPSGLDCIGLERTEKLVYKPVHFYIKQIIRNVYNSKSGEWEVVTTLHERAIDKCIPGPSLSAVIQMDIFKDTLSLSLQRQWLAYSLQNIMRTKYFDVPQLLFGNIKPICRWSGVY